jgi:hypothetical protein
MKHQIISIVGQKVFYDYNGILCSMEITKGMCHEHLSYETIIKYEQRDGKMLLDKAEVRGIFYPVPEELTKFEMSIIVEKEHLDCGEQVSIEEAVVIEDIYLRKYFNQHN